MSKIKVIDIYGGVAVDVLAKHFAPDRCLNASRITMEVMRKFNVPAFALYCRVLAVNGAMAVRMEQEGGRLPDNPEESKRWFEECGAHSIGLGYGLDPRPNRYNGHVVVIARGVLIDASAVQMARPERNMAVPPILTLDAISEEFLRGEVNTGVELPDGTVLSYRAYPENKSYEKAEGFLRHPRNMGVVDEIVTEMKRRM